MQQAAHDEGESQDLNNYKGIYANDDNSQKYQCPVTGAHFEVKDLCRRLTKVIEVRKPIEDQIYGTTTTTTSNQIPLTNKQTVSNQKATDLFTSSMVSEKLGQMH